MSESPTLPVDPETERLAHRVARAKGKPVAIVVRDAIEAIAREAGLSVPKGARPSAAEKRRRLLEISKRSAARPVIDNRAPEEIIGYVDRGIPE